MGKKRLSDKAFITKYKAITNDFFVLKFFLYLALAVLCLASFIIIYGFIYSYVTHRFADYELFKPRLCCVLILDAIVIWGIKSCNMKRKEKIEKALDMSEEQATNLYRLLSSNAIPWFQRICMLNPSTKSGQVELLKEWFKIDDEIVSEYIFEKEYSEMDLLQATANSLSEKKSIVEKLFKLAIVEDGIHNDEWNLLMKIMEEMDFNHNFINYFIRRYKSLRTESENSSNNESTSTEEKSISLLKPYYDILGLEVGASDEEIKKAYHNLALQHHPDMRKNSGRTKECEKMMAKINEAVEKIRN